MKLETLERVSNIIALIAVVVYVVGIALVVYLGNK